MSDQVGFLVKESGIIVDKRVGSGNNAVFISETLKEASLHPERQYIQFDDIDQPAFADARIEKVVIPALQEQLFAVWKDGARGGIEMEAMRAKMQPFIPPVTPIVTDK